MENTSTLTASYSSEDSNPQFDLEHDAGAAVGGRAKRLRQRARRPQSVSLPPAGSLVSHGEVPDIGMSLLTAGEGLRAVMAKVDLVARTDYPVLLIGEHGTGKSWIAQALHERSARRHAQVLRVNCDAIAPGQADAVLFGSSIPSSARSSSRQSGLIERAHGGTIVLEDVGKLPRWTQAKLLSVMQDGKLECVDGHVVPVDIRIIATIHDGPDNRGTHGVQPDLWYTLNVFSIQVPSLRERRSDIPALATLLAQAVGERLYRSTVTPTAADLERLAMHDWPGNFRELAAVVEQAVVLGGGRRLETRRALRYQRALGIVAGGKQNDGFVTLDQCVRGHIREALARTENRIDGAEGAAQLLGVQTRALIMEMRRLGLHSNGT